MEFLCLIPLKLLFFPAYYSTDLHVHRNWLRVAELPLKEWYTDQKNVWTLDYPPLFGYLQWAMGRVAAIFHQKMLQSQQDLDDQKTIFIMRGLLAFSEFFFLWLVFRKKKNYEFFIFLPGIILIDDIHFQFNSMLYALLILAMEAAKEGKFIKSSILYGILLGFKHINLYLAPAFALYIIKNTIFKGDYRNFVLSVAGGISTLILILAPFYLNGTILNLKQRLFPFKRGLVHDYWAPNIWALYMGIDMTLCLIYKRIFGYQLLWNRKNPTFLPQISPLVCLFLTIIGLILVVRQCYKGASIFKLGAMSNLVFFLAGYHVHQKAMVITILLLMWQKNGQKQYQPLNQIAQQQDRQMEKITFLASASCSSSIGTLLFTQPEVLFKYIYNFLFHYFWVRSDQLNLGWRQITFILATITVSLLSEFRSVFLGLAINSNVNAMINLWTLFKL